MSTRPFFLVRRVFALLLFWTLLAPLWADSLVLVPPPSEVWHTPNPPYPYQARTARVQGTGVFRVVTDDTGHVHWVSPSKSTGSGLLDRCTRLFALKNWSGPPNSVRKVPVSFRLQ